MSSTGRIADRQPNDEYPTPRWCVHRLLERYDLVGGFWLEPCAGAGSIIRAVSECRSDVHWQANEINPAYHRELTSLPQVLRASSVDARQLLISLDIRVVLTNPPFGPSLEILERMIQTGARVVFLQRLNWAAGPRRERFRTLFPSVYVLPDRPSFIDTYEEHAPDVLKPGTDSIEYAWFIFDGRGQFRVLGDTPPDVRAAEIEEGRANRTRPRRLATPKKAKAA